MGALCEVGRVVGQNQNAFMEVHFLDAALIFDTEELEHVEPDEAVGVKLGFEDFAARLNAHSSTVVIFAFSANINAYNARFVTFANRGAHFAGGFEAEREAGEADGGVSSAIAMIGYLSIDE